MRQKLITPRITPCRVSKLLGLTLILFFLAVNQAQARSKLGSLLWKTAATASVTLIAMTNPAKSDGVTLELGGDEDGGFEVMRIGLQWDWNDNLMQVRGWDLSTYWQLEFSKWQQVDDGTQNGANVTAGIIPMFRFTGTPGYYQPFIDVGVGISLFTDSKMEGHEFGSNFQFTDVLSVGMNSGKRNQWGFAYKFEHYSNGSVRPPNSGINFHFLTMTYNY
jgi:lipid A 3-O-deacylase